MEARGGGVSAVRGVPGEDDAAHPALRRGAEALREPAPRRVIFLDFDGVLAPIRRWDRYEDLDPACVRILNEIVAHCEAEVVVSSTWRYGKSVPQLQALLDAKGFAGRVLDKTPSGGPGTDRSDEITAWLAEHEVAGYVIIDDHVVSGELRSRLVLTEPGYGLRPVDTSRAIEMLMRPLASPRSAPS